VAQTLILTSRQAVYFNPGARLLVIQAPRTALWGELVKPAAGCESANRAKLDGWNPHISRGFIHTLGAGF